MTFRAQSISLTTQRKGRISPLTRLDDLKQRIREKKKGKRKAINKAITTRMETK